MISSISASVLLPEGWCHVPFIPMRIDDPQTRHVWEGPSCFFRASYLASHPFLLSDTGLSLLFFSEAPFPLLDFFQPPDDGFRFNDERFKGVFR